LKERYEIKEEEGLEKFESALTKMHEYESRVVQSKDIKDLTDLITQTNKQLQMRFKREHKYNLE
jgi:hypothetical protein